MNITELPTVSLPMSNAELRVFDNPEITCAAVANSFAEIARTCLAGCGRFTVALSGGETPRRLYEIIAEAYRDSLPWGKIHVFWGDDRFVPHEDKSSNYRMAKEALLDHVPLPPSNVHPMPTFFQDPKEGAAEYEATLKETFHNNWPKFDLMLQGMGADGHTASLFPHSPALHERSRWVLAVEASTPPPFRLTLTPPVLNHAARIWFLVTGEEKAEALSQVLGGEADPEEYPSAIVRPDQGEIIFWADQAAASSVCTSQPD
jgi:6-phosphogluconolactonase